MPPYPVVRWAALFWGLAVFFPIGLNYTAFVLLAAAFLWQGGWNERGQRLRSAPQAIPALLLLVWLVLVLVAGPHYAETASNSFHAARVLLTLALVLMLSRDEAVWGLRGFFIGLVVALCLVALELGVGLPASRVWEGIVHYGGNKSLANAALMALAAVTGMLLFPGLSGRQRATVAVLTIAALGTLIGVLHSRTAWLIVLVGILAGLPHFLRLHGRRSTLVLAAVAALTLTGALMVPGVKERVTLGVTELSSAYDGKKVDPDSSWGIRFRMYSETAAMVRERPWMGWGMGGWSAQWKERVQGPLAATNMPHNDLLWMGAQAGVPGALLLLWMLVAGLPAAWRRQDLSGNLGLVGVLAMLITVASNSALRDASIGLSVWFVALLYQRLATEPPQAWLDALQGAGAFSARR